MTIGGLFQNRYSSIPASKSTKQLAVWVYSWMSKYIVYQHIPWKAQLKRILCMVSLASRILEGVLCYLLIISSAFGELVVPLSAGWLPRHPSVVLQHPFWDEAPDNTGHVSCRISSLRNQDLTDGQQVDVSSFNAFLNEIEAARGNFPEFQPGPINAHCMMFPDWTSPDLLD